MSAGAVDLLGEVLAAFSSRTRHPTRVTAAEFETVCSGCVPMLISCLEHYLSCCLCCACIMLEEKEEDGSNCHASQTETGKQGLLTAAGMMRCQILNLNLRQSKRTTIYHPP